MIQISEISGTCQAACGGLGAQKNRLREFKSGIMSMRTAHHGETNFKYMSRDASRDRVQYSTGDEAMKL